MTNYYNPALHEEPQNQPTKIFPLIPRETLFSWLESSGRFRKNDIEEFQGGDDRIPDELDDILEPEIYALENEEEELE